jgi:hypothetical protein
MFTAEGFPAAIVSNAIVLCIQRGSYEASNCCLSPEEEDEQGR